MANYGSNYYDELFTSTKIGVKYLRPLLSSIYIFISLELINKKALHDLVFHKQCSKREYL